MTIVDHHHYKGDTLTRTERVERVVVNLLLDSTLDDSQRESSIVWELKHSSGCCQIARILAQSRGLDIEIAEVAALLHDIYVITDGSYTNHAVLGAPVAAGLLKQSGGFDDAEIAQICSAIAHHSEKDTYSDDPYVELIKDVDVFDCSLYRGSENYYLIHKPIEVVREYENRVAAVRKELQLPDGETFRK